MLKQQKIFFDFLRFCIGSADEIPSSLKEADWKELYAIAKKQCLVGVLFDGIKKLPAEHVGMEKELLLQWMAESQMLEKANVRLNDAAIQVSEWFRKKGFRTCILKGQGNALMYPNPYSRTPGDIDIWVEGGDKRVISFVRSISPHEKACYHHIEFPSYKGVEVEVHYRPSFLLCFWHNRKLQKYYERVKEEQFSHRVMLGEQGEIAIPMVEFNLIFQLTHIFSHLMNEGIGLRQLVDYYYVLCEFYKVYQNSSNPSVSLSKGSSTFSPSPSSSGSGDVTAPSRCSEPLRSKDGGPSKVSPDCAGWDRLTDACLRPADGLTATCLRAGDGLGATCLRPADRLADGAADRLGATCLRPADELAPIQVLVNVDIFSEGFDCPDVEFVQLARPTLSLAKYLQMVGRGLRVAKGKKNCVIIDNVGLYRVFGLPSQVWNWNAMFEGKLRVGKKKETPKEREYFLMNEKQDSIQIHPDSEMMMVMSHEELLQTLQYREFVDSKGEFAIIKLSDGKMTVVNRQGEQVLEPGDYYDMKLLDGNILFYRPRRKAKCYYDLLAKAVIDDGTNVAETPHVVNIKGWEFIEYNDIFMSRTQEDFSLPYHPSQYDFLNYGYYMIFRFRPSAPGCQVWYYGEGDEGKMRMSNEESRNVCFLRNDYEHVYWLCAVLYGERIVVMDSKEDYYLVDSNLKKTYIGCNHPKNENENLNFVMPRLGKKYYHEAMLQKKEMEANEMLLLHEKSEAGHVELYQAGKKWGVKVDGKVIVPPLYCSIAQPVGAYCAFEEIPRHWGVMTLKGKVIVDAKYEKVEIRDNGIAIVTGITGKTQTIKLLKVKE